MKFKTACLAASLAAAGLATTGLAHAQSKVELYGIIDTNVQMFNNAPDGPTGSQTVSGVGTDGMTPSRWGLRGSEDLGNGLRAVFQLEGGFRSNTGMLDNGTNRLFNRVSMVGIAGQWGQIGLGRQYSPVHIGTVQVLALGANQFDMVPYVSPVRADNSVVYTGNFGGVGVGAYYSFRTLADQMVNEENTTGRWGAAVNYNHNNQFRFVAGYDRIEEGGLAGGFTPGVDTKFDNWILGARADLGQIRVAGVYRHRKAKVGGGTDYTSNLFQVGVTYLFTPTTTVGVAYHYDKLKDAPASMTNNATRRDDKWQQFVVQGTYGLSKRTTVYAQVAHARDGALSLGIGNAGNYRLAADKDNQTGAAIGIRHLF